MADQVIVFDCDSDEQSKGKVSSNPEVNPVSKPLEQSRSSRYAQLLKMRKLKVRPREMHQLEKKEIEQSIDLDKPDEVIVFNLEEPGSIIQHDANASIIPLKTAQFREPPSQIEEHEVQINPPPEAPPIQRQLSQQQRQVTQLQSDDSQSQSGHSHVLPQLQADNLMAAFVPKKALLSVQSEFRVERLLMFPQKFHMYLNGNHLLTARKKLIQSNSLYYFFSSAENLSTKGNNYLGYMEANFNGTEYNIYTHDGINLAYITFLLRKNQQALTNIYIPKILHSKSQSIKKRVMADDPGVIAVNSKAATMNPATKKLSLNFKGRAKMASVKNCVIEQEGQYVLILGKVQQKLYNLDFGQPFSQITAFGFAISNYEEKLGDKAKY